MHKMDMRGHVFPYSLARRAGRLTIRSGATAEEEDQTQQCVCTCPLASEH